MNTNSLRYYSIDSLIRKKDCIIDNDGSIDTQANIKPEAWFQRYWEPCIACGDEERIGLIGDGGKWICNPVKELQYKNCMVVSIGSNNEFSFEDEIVERFGCEVHIFDHTSYPPAESKPHFHFHKLGLDIVTRGNMLSLHDMITMAMANTKANHALSIVDILKIDCEGCEFDALTSPASVNILQTKVKQLLLEVHNFREDFMVAKRYPVDKRYFSKLWVSLQTHSWMLPFHKEPNIEWSFNSSFAIEYAFLNKQYVRKYLP